MKRLILLPTIMAVVLLSGCHSGNHFISDKNYRNKVVQQFDKQKKLAINRKDQLFNVFNEDISMREKEALEFLYAYMPLSDLADYDGDFYLKNIKASFAAKDTFSWGKGIPEVIFRHFVLPIRVNNENLDSSRWVFFSELKDRIKHSSMKEAALEVNHWCHEKVTYKGSDNRTSAPLATVKNAYGRCGEESTFTVSALRAVGIPARQCYTPRWAHTDDNHAWVEVWVDGKWHYLGACEPEPDLDLAWFTGPAKRAMLVNTNVFGDYSGPEDVLIKDARYTRINVLSNYTSTKKIWVKIANPENKPVDSAVVEFQLYNYAEFYPLQRCFTDKKGLCSFTSGFGDLLIWAAKGEKFGYKKISITGPDTITIELTHSPGEVYTEALDFVPPPEIKIENTVSDSSRARNTKRFAFEDQLRSTYENTFIDSLKSNRIAANLKVNTDSLWQFLHKSRGNWREIIEFISSVQADKRSWAFILLNEISEKDLHDVTHEVLDDNILHSWMVQSLTKDKAIFSSYILCPRVDNEYLKPYKEFFQHSFTSDFAIKGQKDPETIVKWIKTNIKIDEDANYARAPITPRGVYELKVADPHSRDIFFVAICRSFGIAARLETATRIPQYFNNGKWQDVYFNNAPSKNGVRGKLVMNCKIGKGAKPEYYTHFTIEKLENGFFRSLDYETDPVLKSFPCTLEVPQGSYLLVTGNRIGGGTVLANLTFFNIDENKVQNTTLELRKDPAPGKVLGKIQRLEAYFPLASGKQGLGAKKGIIIAWIDPEKEPSRHFISDLLQKKKELDLWDGSLLLLFKTEKEEHLFMSKNGKALQKNTRTAIDNAGSLAKFMALLPDKSATELPVVTFIHPNGDISYFSSGYRIGIGYEILKEIHQ